MVGFQDIINLVFSHTLVDVDIGPYAKMVSYYRGEPSSMLHY